MATMKNTNTKTAKTGSTWFLLAKVVVTFLLLGAVESQYSLDDFGMCGDCYCIFNATAGQTCPEPPPQTNFTTLLPTLKALNLVNPITLSCNPYIDVNCTTTPKQVSGGACVLTLIPSSGKCERGWNYSLSTYAGTYQEAILQGLYVTHSTPCGVCSSLQDLAVYMKTGPNLSNYTSKCEDKGLASGTAAGIACLENLGFTTPCATLWYYETNNTNYVCESQCSAANGSVPAYGPAPTCNLAPCLGCDDTNSTPVFKLYAGRTRRTSGLLSNLPRSCSGIAQIDQVDPCTYVFIPPTASPTVTKTPTVSPTISVSPTMPTTSAPTALPKTSAITASAQKEYIEDDPTRLRGPPN